MSEEKCLSLSLISVVALARYFDEVSKDSGQYCFGIDETLKALEMGAVETLIVWENFDVTRYVLKNIQTQESKVIHLRADQEKEKSHFQDKDTGVELEHVEEMPLLEWFANNYKNFGEIDGREREKLMTSDFQVPSWRSSLIKVKKVRNSSEDSVEWEEYFVTKSICKISTWTKMPNRSITVRRDGQSN